METFDCLIIGGGVVGLTAALAMAQQQFSVGIWDAKDFLSIEKEPPSDPRVYAINHASRKLLSSLGVWSLIPEHRISPYERMHIWDAASTNHIDFDAAMIASRDLGVILEESVIKYALMKKLVSYSQVKLFPNQRIEKVKANYLPVELFSHEQRWEGKLVIIADGRGQTARQLLNISATSWSYKQHALVARVTTELPHHQTAYQVFNRDGPLAFLPLAHPHECSIVWSTSPEKADELSQLDNQEFNNQLSKAFFHKLGQVRLSGERHQFPLSMSHTQKYVGPHWLLMGDAAHTIHPLAGLGLNLGLADVASWLELVKERKNKSILQATLNAYQRHRKQDLWKAIALVEAIKALFLNPFPPCIALRGFGMKIMNQLNPVKRLLIEMMENA